MEVKENDFVEIDYTARVKESNEVFDTTDLEEAKKHGLYHEGLVFGSVVACIGKGIILHGLEKRLVGKELGEFDIELSPEEGFGKKSAKLIQLIPTSKLTKQKITPVPGLQISVDGMLGTIKTVTGGRTVVDFNHQLAGRELKYHVHMKRIVTDDKEKAEALLKWHFRLEPKSLEVNDKSLVVCLSQEIPKDAQEHLSKEILAHTSLTEVVFKTAESLNISN
jgi:FKBP-type peptidyl-prolyl cis-trans isomerase 2